jgi:hypothetical protein
MVSVYLVSVLAIIALICMLIALNDSQRKHIATA